MKVDYKKELSKLYKPKSRPEVVVVPAMQFVMINGEGDPNTAKMYTDAVRTLFAVSYTLKFMCKKQLGADYAVMPLEGLWWAEDMAHFLTTPKSEWLWTAMIMQPPMITQELFMQAKTEVAKKGKGPLLDAIRFETYDEGRAAQVMYTGAYSDEGPTIQQLHVFIADHGGVLTKTTKHHHEIYLGDPRRTVPDKLKTIIRQPF